ASDSGVVHQDVDLAEAGDDSFYSGFDFFFAGDVDFEGCGFASSGGNLAGKLVQFFLIASAKSDFGSSAGEHERTSAANSLRRSGDECYAAFHSCHGDLLMNQSRIITIALQRDAVRALEQSLGRPDQHLESARKVREIWGCGQFDASSLRQGVEFQVDGGRLQFPRQMMNIGAIEALATGRVETIALGQEVLERPGIHAGWPRDRSIGRAQFRGLWTVCAFGTVFNLRSA